MTSKLTNENIAAKIYHALYPQQNFYHKNSTYQRKQWERMVKELKEQGIIND